MTGGNRRSLRRAMAGCAAAIAAVALVACAPDRGPFPTAAPTEAPVYVPTYETPAPTVIAPLTGERVDAAGIATPSLAAKIDNHWDARPQVGLERTDIVFEELVEGGLTRYVAIWHSDVPTQIGPVRSIRPMDPDIISPFGGIVAYSGGQLRFVALMRDTPVYNAIHGQPDTASTFFRTDTKVAPHNVLVKAPEVIAQHADLAAPRQQFAFALDLASATATKEGAATERIDARFSNATQQSWVWDDAGAVWLRSQSGEADLDSNGDQLSATNVVIVRVPVTHGLGVPKTELIGSGEAWVSSGGATVRATWSKRSPTAPIRLVDESGVTVRLAPGNTWIELVPTTGSVDFAPPGD